MGRGQNINIKRSLEEVDSSPHGWLWGFCGGSNSRYGGNSKELEVNSGDVTAFLQSHDQTLMDEELLPMNEQR